MSNAWIDRWYRSSIIWQGCGRLRADNEDRQDMLLYGAKFIYRSDNDIGKV